MSLNMASCDYNIRRLLCLFQLFLYQRKAIVFFALGNERRVDQDPVSLVPLPNFAVFFSSSEPGSKSLAFQLHSGSIDTT